MGQLFCCVSKVGRRLSGDAGPRPVCLHIVPTGKTSSDLVFGLAFLDERGVGKYSDVFLDRIEEACAESGADLSRLLGAVAAHELGHLL